MVILIREILSINKSAILWGDETFGRHALSSRGWGSQNKRSIEPMALHSDIDQG
jgi:hypothetical protein